MGNPKLCLLLATVGACFVTGCELGDFQEDEGLESAAANPEVQAPYTGGDGGFSLPRGTQWIYGSDISSWAQNITLSSARVTREGGANNYHTAYVKYSPDLPVWKQNPDPAGYNENNVVATIWLLREFEGRWYMGSFDYLRKGQFTKKFAALPAFKVEPRSGEPIAFMVSTVARQWDGTRVDGDPNSPYRWRSNLYWTTWP
jgi:hypothetical protein